MASDSSTTHYGAAASPATSKTVSSALTAPPIIHELVAKFAEHYDTYKRGDYNETQLRRDFLDPSFAAMGWDIDNRKGYAEKFHEVIHEDALRVNLSVKAPDSARLRSSSSSGGCVRHRIASGFAVLDDDDVLDAHCT